MKSRTLAAAFATAAFTIALPATAQDAYVIGLTGAMTGPAPPAPMLPPSMRCASTSIA